MPFGAGFWSRGMKQERIARVQPRKPKNPEVVEEIVVDEADAGLLSDIDELLDEIDSVLEDQSALVDFRQRSGE
jgi:hypothetical protein